MQDHEKEGEMNEPVSDSDNDEAENSADEVTSDEEITQEKTVKPLTAEALAEFEAAQKRAGVIYISRIPPGMRPAKVRHILSAYGEIGRVYLQQEDPKRAYLRKKHTSTNKAHYTEGWVEFASKKVARSVAEMLNAQPIGGKKGSRWRDDIWTMKYLPRFKWNMLTEQIANETATRAAQLRLELSQSKHEQKQYLKQVELARVLDKRAKKKEADGSSGPNQSTGEEPITSDKTKKKPKKIKIPKTVDFDCKNEELESVLSSVF
ncbi:RNA-binding ATPase activator esf2 [Tulasnella sp. 419]|nr:RNA-binding ATPase activator esf2 [Tulasnella sp. 419]